MRSKEWRELHPSCRRKAANYHDSALKGMCNLGRLNGSIPFRGAIYLEEFMKIIDELIERMDLHIKNACEEYPTKESLGISFLFGNKQVYIQINKGGCDIEIVDFDKNTFLDNVAKYCEKCVTLCECAEEISEWDLNGFLNEDDYLTYKYR